MPNERALADTNVATAQAASGTHGDGGARKGDVLRSMRASDIEPYTGLRYLSKLFRMMAILLLLVVVEETITGFYRFGMGAVPVLLGVVTRLLVAAGLLWGVGDLALLLIDVGHDVRAARILLARQLAHQAGEAHASLTPMRTPAMVPIVTASAAAGSGSSPGAAD
jgi:hypothetical protein